MSLVPYTPNKTPMINIDELHRVKEEKDRRRLSTYQEVLKLCHHRIQYTSRVTGETYCWYLIPNVISGLPLYDINECILYVVQALVDNGFQIRYTHPNLLFISWLYKPPKKSESYRNIQDSQKRDQGYRPTSEYQPTNKFVQEDQSYRNSLQSLKDKANQLLYG